MDGTERILRERYAPHTLPKETEITKAHKLPLATRITIAEIQGLPKFVIDIMRAELEEE
jgi:hypothetical protein